MAIKNGLLIADVFHQRLIPKRHGLGYKVYYLSFPLQKIEELNSGILSYNNFNLLSFYNKDYGDKKSDPEIWARKVLSEWGINNADGDIVLVTMPRILGYGFNPVSFWFCMDKAGLLRAVISEVNNTFGEKHCYICSHEDGREIMQNDWLSTKKLFHVSPFMNVSGEYKFRFAYSENKIGVWIDYYDNGQKVLITSMVGKRIELNKINLIKCFLKFPLVTLKVILLIHYHALRLVFKGIKYNRKPFPPDSEISR